MFQGSESMGTPRKWFPKEFSRIVNFIPTYFMQHALYQMRGVMPEVFKFDGVVSVSTEKSKTLQNVKDKEKDVSIKVVLGHRPAVHVQHPVSNVLNVNTPTKPFNEILEDAIDITGRPELFPELVIHDLGLKFKIPEAVSEYVQGINDLFQYVRHRGYHTKTMRELFHVRFFKPAITMEAYLKKNKQIVDTVEAMMAKLNVKGNPVDLRRWRSILETKWITGDTKGFFDFSHHLLNLQMHLTKNKFEQDVAIYHTIANQYIADEHLEIGGHIYELKRVSDSGLYSPLVPLWHEEIPKGLQIK